MKIIIIFILSIFYYTPLEAQDGAEGKNQVICNIAGQVWKSTYVFDINELPKYCDIILIAEYYISNSINGSETPMVEADKSIIRSLVEAKKSVYVRIGLVYEDAQSSLFNPPDKDTFQKTFDPLVNFLNELKINGIIFDFLSIYEVTMDDLEHKINDFVTNIKTKVNNLQVGLVIEGWNYKYFTNDTLFDFTITNTVLDLYMIDWSSLNICDKDSVKTGISPVTSNIANMVTIEQVNSGVTNSSMDKSKIYAMLQISVVMPYNLLNTDPTQSMTTYSIYCSSTDPANSSQLCTNPSQLSYDQGAYAKEFYVGIVLKILDADDYEDKCGCGKFPVSNQIIDGWTGSPLKACPKLDHKQLNTPFTTQVFDFTITNKNMDLYVINWSLLNVCHNDTEKCGLSSITSNISDMVTIEQVNIGVTYSSMDKLKMYAMIQMLPGAYAKQSYAGIVLEQFDTNDYEGFCEYENFSVSTKLLMNGRQALLKRVPK